MGKYLIYQVLHNVIGISSLKPKQKVLLVTNSYSVQAVITTCILPRETHHNVQLYSTWLNIFFPWYFILVPTHQGPHL